jgi:hypothetical protein
MSNGGGDEEKSRSGDDASSESESAISRRTAFAFLAGVEGFADAVFVGRVGAAGAAAFFRGLPRGLFAGDAGT